MLKKQAQLPKVAIFLIYFLLPAYSVLGAITYYVFSHDVDREIKATKKIEYGIINTNNQALSGELKAVLSDLAILAQGNHLKSLINGEPEQLKTLEEDMVLFCGARKMYDQIRYMDENGMEQVRVNDGPDGAYAVSRDKLQNKKDRYYFTDTFELEKGKVFVSPLDLNIEHGVIEMPLKPMIRFGTPVFNSHGDKKGIVMLNYYGKRLIDAISSLGRKSSGKTMLVNSDSYYLKGPSESDEWGFMYPDRKDKRFDLEHNHAWETILTEQTGQFFHNGNLYTFSTVYPVPESIQSSNGSGEADAPSSYHLEGHDYFWKIITLVPESVLQDKRLGIIKNYIIIIIPVLFIVGLGSWLLALFRVRRIQAENELVEVNRNLEDTVATRTVSLIEMNQVLNDRIQELNEAKDILAEGERYYRALIDHIQEDILVIDPDHIVTDVNETFLSRVGLSRDQAIGRYCFDVSHEQVRPCDIDKDACPHLKVLAHGETVRSVHQYTGGNGEKTWVENVFSPLKSRFGEVTHVIKVTRDITEEKHLENQLRQAQKMEAIGRLAGGIAHDFNNILFPIMGYTEMAMEELNGKDKVLKEFLDEILSGVMRAKNLVSQILAFSYQTEHELKPMKINIVVKEAVKLLKSTIPTTIEIQSELDPGCFPILCDATQVHQIVMNLCTNAYHAMEGQPGKVHVRLHNVDLSENDVAGTDKLPGRYVCLHVSDNGKGIDRDIMDRIFEPYFTTKEKGKGTGLGLSVVNGIVKSYGGYIDVTSEKGKGTQFNIYFPALEKEEQYIPKVEDKHITSHQVTGEHLMVVDDDPTVLEMEKKALSKLGYMVSAYISSVDAYKAFKETPGNYDMVITDYTMPNLTGEALARKINHVKKETPIIMLTGFSAKINPGNAKKIGIKAYVSKPVILSHLTRTIRLVLDGDEDVSFFSQNSKG